MTPGVRSILALTALLSGCATGWRGALPPPPPPVEAPAPPPSANGSLWRADVAANYTVLDVRAHFPGDLLTVLIAEQSKGKKDAATDGKAESSMSASVEEFFGIPSAAVKILPKGFRPESVVKAETKRDSKGEGTTTRAGTLQASITVTVVAVEPGGVLRLQGDKIITVNREDQHIVLTGRVRPEDIAADNTVLSSRIADARISYYGYGVVGDKQGTPLTHWLFDWIWPF